MSGNIPLWQELTHVPDPEELTLRYGNVEAVTQLVQLDTLPEQVLQGELQGVHTKLVESAK